MDFVHPLDALFFALEVLPSPNSLSRCCCLSFLQKIRIVRRTLCQRTARHQLASLLLDIRRQLLPYRNQRNHECQSTTPTTARSNSIEVVGAAGIYNRLVFCVIWLFEATKLAFFALILILSLKPHRLLPAGLIQAVAHYINTIPLRIWVLDNSAMMQVPDGHRISGSTFTGLTKSNCSRWEEAQDEVAFHAYMSGCLGVPTRFNMVNAPISMTGAQLPSCFSIAERGADHPASERLC